MKQFNTNAALLRSDLDQIKSKLSAPALVSQWREQEFWFENLIENGTFDSDTEWTKGDGWSIGSGVSSCSGAQTGNSSFKQANNGVFDWGTQYFTTFTISNYVAGYVNPHIRSSSSGNVSGNGQKSSIITAGNNSADGLNLYADQNFQADIDNVAVFNSDGTNAIHYMPEGWTPHNVYVDGLLIREGAAHDYTVETDNFDTWIKPAVAPGALTETCIMGVRKV